jgi:hypothetical protein
MEDQVKKAQTLVLEIMTLQAAITDNIFKLSKSDQELLNKLETFRNGMIKLANKLAWQNKN